MPKLPEMNRIDDFRFEVKKNSLGYNYNEQSYFVFYKDTRISPERVNAMNIDELHIINYWNRLESAIDRSKTDSSGFTEKDRERLKLYQTSLEHRTRMEASGIQLFKGCSGPLYRDILASIAQKVAASNETTKKGKNAPKRAQDEGQEADVKPVIKPMKPKSKAAPKVPTMPSYSSTRIATRMSIMSLTSAPSSAGTSSAGTSSAGTSSAKSAAAVGKARVKREPQSPVLLVRVKEEPRSTSPEQPVQQEVRRSQRVRQQRQVDQDVVDFMNTDSPTRVIKTEKRSVTPKSWKSK